LAGEFLRNQSEQYNRSQETGDQETGDQKTGDEDKQRRDENRSAFIDLCIVMFNSAEFLYVD
jgi:hypothetical protein